MLPPPIPANEAARVQAVEQADVLDTLPDPQFDDLVLLASTICQTPIAVISFITADKQILKSRVGLNYNSTPRDIAFCAHAIAQNDLFIVPDSLKDQRFLDNPNVLGDPNIRFYAGMPVIDDKGCALGTVCVIDRVPRELTDKQKTALRVLARHVLIHLEIRNSEMRAKVDSIPRT
jgi:GAF domain-containing protein